MRDDSALIRAARARWLLVPSVSGVDDQANSARVDAEAVDEAGSKSHERAYLKIALPEGSLHLGKEDLVVGSHEACHLPLASPWVRASFGFVGA